MCVAYASATRRQQCLDALRLFQGVVLFLHHVVSYYYDTSTARVKVILQLPVAAKEGCA